MPPCLQYLIEGLEFTAESARTRLMPLCTLDKLAVAHRLMFVHLVKKTGLEAEQKKKEEEGEGDWEVGENENGGEESMETFDSSFLSEMYEVRHVCLILL